MRKLLFLLGCAAVVSLLSACVRNDDEPLAPIVPISRLYVSLFEFQQDETADPYSNLLIIDPATANQLQGTFFNPQIREGSGVFFSPDVSRVFQGSVQDQSVVMMSVTDIGIPQRSGQLRNDSLTAIRGIHYDHTSRNLYVANNWTPSGIYVFDNPLNRNGTVEPRRYFNLGGVRPWGITMFKDNLLVVRTGESTGINFYANVSALVEGTGDLVPTASLTLAGAGALRGVAYSERLDVLVVSDFQNAQILVVENASQYFKSSTATIQPTRIIAGSNTGLLGPVDVALDDREGSNLIFVADKTSKSILRFPITAQGNAAPSVRVQLPLSPESVFMDARGLIE
jgi:hypothetical protein